jgi:hypothetical protein
VSAEAGKIERRMGFQAAGRGGLERLRRGGIWEKNGER